MSIELPINRLTVFVFIVILIVFECLFYIVGKFIANFVGLQGWEYWIVVIGVCLICTMVFVNIKAS